jgi:hypothetical protein
MKDPIRIRINADPTVGDGWGLARKIGRWLNTPIYVTRWWYWLMWVLVIEYALETWWSWLR